MADGCFGTRTRALLILVNLRLGVGNGLARVATVAEIVDRVGGLQQMVQVTKVPMRSENITFIVILSRVETKFKTRSSLGSEHVESHYWPFRVFQCLLCPIPISYARSVSVIRRPLSMSSSLTAIRHFTPIEVVVSRKVIEEENPTPISVAKFSNASRASVLSTHEPDAFELLDWV